MFNKKKEIARICKNCKLFNPAKSECSVVILHEGKRLHLPVVATESCFFEEEYFDPSTKAMEDFADEIKQVKFWVEDEKGNKTDGNGIVKMEYPEGFIAYDDVSDLCKKTDPFDKLKKDIDRGDIAS